MHRPELIVALALGFVAGCRCGPERDQRRPTDSDTNSVVVNPTADTSVETAHTGGTHTGEPELGWQSAMIGYSFGCGVLTDGTIRCWGEPACTSQAPPTDPERSPVFTSVSVALDEACAIRDDGTLDCWCCGFVQHICDDVPNGTFDKVVVANGYACARRTDGTIRCFGKPAGFLQVGSIPADPVEDFDVEMGRACAIVGGEITCWGQDGSWFWHDPPVGSDFVRIGIGRSQGCALDTSGQAHGWGFLGAPGNPPFPDPPLGTFATVEAYGAISCVLDASGVPTCWGFEDDPGPYAPAFVVPDELFSQFNVSEWHGCGVTLDGRALCWGRDRGFGETVVPEL